MHLALLAALLSGMGYAGLRNLKEQRRYVLSNCYIKSLPLYVFVFYYFFYSIIGEYRYLRKKLKRIHIHN